MRLHRHEGSGGGLLDRRAGAAAGRERRPRVVRACALAGGAAVATAAGGALLLSAPHAALVELPQEPQQQIRMRSHHRRLMATEEDEALVPSRGSRGGRSFLRRGGGGGRGAKGAVDVSADSAAAPTSDDALPGFDPASNICLLTIMTQERMASLHRMLAAWDGYISIALLVDSYDDAHRDGIELLRYRGRLPPAPQRITLTIVEDRHYRSPHNRFPYNVLRNAALDGCTAPYVMAADVDFVPHPPRPSAILRRALTEPTYATAARTCSSSRRLRRWSATRGGSSSSSSSRPHARCRRRQRRRDAASRTRRRGRAAASRGGRRCGRLPSSSGSSPLSSSAASSSSSSSSSGGGGGGGGGGGAPLDKAAAPPRAARGRHRGLCVARVRRGPPMRPRARLPREQRVVPRSVRVRLEPYTVVPRAMAHPYEERFVGYGKDRVSWNYELAAKGAVFWVPSEPFLVHFNTYDEEEASRPKKKQYGHFPNDWMLGESCWPAFRDRVQSQYNFSTYTCHQTAIDGLHRGKFEQCTAEAGAAVRQAVLLAADDNRALPVADGRRAAAAHLLPLRQHQPYPSLHFESAAAAAAAGRPVAHPGPKLVLLGCEGCGIPELWRTLVAARPPSGKLQVALINPGEPAWRDRQVHFSTTRAASPTATNGT